MKLNLVHEEGRQVEPMGVVSSIIKKIELKLILKKQFYGLIIKYKKINNT
jgi:hypothetical protein